MSQPTKENVNFKTWLPTPIYPPAYPQGSSGSSTTPSHPAIGELTTPHRAPPYLSYREEACHNHWLFPPASITPTLSPSQLECTRIRQATCTLRSRASGDSGRRYEDSGLVKLRVDIRKKSPTIRSCRVDLLATQSCIVPQYPRSERPPTQWGSWMAVGAATCLPRPAPPTGARTGGSGCARNIDKHGILAGRVLCAAAPVSVPLHARVRPGLLPAPLASGGARPALSHTTPELLHALRPGGHVGEPSAVPRP